MDSERNLLLARLGAPARQALGRDTEHVQLTHGDVLYEAGDVLDHVYFPTSGMISVVTVMQDGHSVECATVGREGCAGLSTGGRIGEAFNRFVVQLPGSAVRVPARDVLALTGRDPVARAVFDRFHEFMYDTATQGLACNALHTSERRCARWIATMRDRADTNELLLTQEFLAEMLGVQRAAVNVAAQGLADAGIIEYHRGRITVLDRDGLEQASCECYRRLLARQAFLFPDSLD